MPPSTPPTRSVPTQWPGIRRRLLRQARLAAARVWDRPVSWQLYGRPLTIPLSSDLPYFMDHGGDYATNVGRLARALHEAGATPVAIDVGANVGDTAHILLAHVPGTTVLCVEADEGYYANLVANVRLLPGVTPVLALVGDGTDSTGLSVTRLRGTGQVNRSAATATTVPALTITELVERHPDFAAASLFKTDTDGYDFAILTGALPWLARARPAVFLEYDPARAEQAAGPEAPSGVQALAALAELGYGPTVVWDNCGFPHAALDITDTEAVADLDSYIRLRPDFYVDLAVFPREQAAVAARLRATERAYFT